MKRARETYNERLKRYALTYTVCFALFVSAMALAEHWGLSQSMVGYVFVFVTIAVYAFVGLASRTADLDEYYVAGRRVPALFNGMASAADWMSAASFVSMTGTLYVGGFDGLVYVMGWTGGFCLVGLLFAPYLRAYGGYTVPDFLAARYGSNAVRALAALAAILCSFVYVIAQVYAVGLVISRFTGAEFGLAVFLGLAGILVCSFLGGMRAITWTQVAQYIVLIVAFLLPAVMLSIRQTGSLVPQLAYGHQVAETSARVSALARDPKEIEVRAQFQEQANELDRALAGLPRSWELRMADEREALETLRSTGSPLADIKAAERSLAGQPQSVEEARLRWTLERDQALARARPPAADSEPYPGPNEAARSNKRVNFIALLFCLMVGTSGLPHILTRYYTTSSVQETRKSVAWSLFLIAILYVTAPALAVFVKADVLSHLVGLPYDHLPGWVSSWGALDRTHPLVSVTDVNHDGIVQFAEVSISPDVFMLAMPEITNLPYFVSGLVAAGGLAAALSTADGLLLTIASAISHDTYFKLIDPAASTQRRVTISKIVLLVVTLVAAYITSLRPGDILGTVGAAFSIAASAFFPPLLLGIFWRRATGTGALMGMGAGLFVCLYYILHTHPFFVHLLGFSAMPLWFGIEPLSAGVFGVPVGLATIVIVSLIAPETHSAEQEQLLVRLHGRPVER